MKKTETVAANKKIDNESKKKRWPRKVASEPVQIDVCDPNRPLVTFRVIGR